MSTGVSCQAHRTIRALSDPHLRLRFRPLPDLLGWPETAHNAPNTRVGAGVKSFAWPSPVEITSRMEAAHGYADRPARQRRYAKTVTTPDTSSVPSNTFPLTGEGVPPPFPKPPYRPDSYRVKTALSGARRADSPTGCWRDEPGGCALIFCERSELTQIVKKKRMARQDRAPLSSFPAEVQPEIAALRAKQDQMEQMMRLRDVAAKFAARGMRPISLKASPTPSSPSAPKR